MIDVLVIDDEELLRDLLIRILRREGYKAESAGNGKEGLQIFSATPARLVVIDMNMPEMDGAATIEALRQHYRDFSVLAMSGNARMSKAANADATIAKPFLPAAFIGLVKDLLPPGGES
jgi:CheY-like chemotaxis protein